jgi:hypothetical protein
MKICQTELERRACARRLVIPEAEVEAFLGDRLRLVEISAPLGPEACLRLRAEILLGYVEQNLLPLLPGEFDELQRIAVAATQADAPFVVGFDWF